MTALESQELQLIREMVEELLEAVKEIKTELRNGKDDGK